MIIDKSAYCLVMVLLAAIATALAQDPRNEPRAGFVSACVGLDDAHYPLFSEMYLVNEIGEFHSVLYGRSVDTKALFPIASKIHPHQDVDAVFETVGGLQGMRNARIVYDTLNAAAFRFFDDWTTIFADTPLDLPACKFDFSAP